MAPTPSTRRDYGDSMYIDTSKQSTVKVKDSNFIVGTEVSNDSIFADNDLVFVSSSSSLSTGSYSAGAVTLNNVTANAAGTVNMSATKMEFGIGKDTLCFASSKNSVITNNSFKMGTGADYVYVAEASTIYAGNTIDMGADSEVDSIRFGGTTSLSNLGTTAKLNLSRFGSNDKLIYKNVTYTGEAGIRTNAELSSKITFNNIV
jgi:hypothetical protein